MFKFIMLTCAYGAIMLLNLFAIFRCVSKRNKITHKKDKHGQMVAKKGGGAKNIIGMIVYIIGFLVFLGLLIVNLILFIVERSGI